MKLPVYLYGHPVLRKTAETVAPGREGLKELLENMYATMYASEGVGLAAVRHTAEKNGGYIRFHYGDGIFAVNVILRSGK